VFVAVSLTVKKNERMRMILARGENIYKRKDGRWEGRYPKEKNADGSIYYGYIYGKTYRIVREQLLAKKSLISASEDKIQQSFKGSFADWVDFWLDQLIKENIKESTYTSYQNKFSLHILPVIGNIPLDQINVQQLEYLISKMNEKLSASSIRITFRLVKSCLEAAKKRGYIQLNPAEQISLPKVERTQVKALTRQQHALLLSESRKDIKGLPITLALETGMRIGEISALKWRDVDFEQNLIYVCRTKQRISNTSNGKSKTKLIETTPKTQRSKRLIPLTSALKKQLLNAKSQSSSQYVVENRGESIEPRTISYRFERMKKTLNLPSLHFHALRHTFATRCIELGVNISTVSALLGHTSTKMTLDIYTHSIFEDQRMAIEKLSSLSS
jgi:integrase